MYTFDQYFWPRNHEHLHNKTVDYFFHLCAMKSYLCTKLTDLAFLVFCYNIWTW